MTKLENTINNYFKSRKEVVAVYLFGSHATGRERPFSDLDIGVILHYHDLGRSVAIQNQYTVALGRKLRKDVHAVILNTAGELLLKQIFKKGIPVCVNDEDEFRRFKMTRYSMVAEFGYYLKMTQAGFIKTLMEGYTRG